MVKASCTTVVRFLTKPPVRMTYPAGIFDMNTAYVGTDRKAPYVYYEPGKTYYVLNKETTVKGINPAADYAANGKNASWIPFENFKAIFVEIFMALFAKLGGAVFWGDYMFSQLGVDANGNATADYQNFDGLATKAFIPNFYVNFRTGKVFARDVEITGIINAIQGTFSNVTIQSGAIAGFSIAGNGLTNRDKEGKFINDAYVIFRNDNYNSFAGIGGNILPPSLGGRAVALFENHDKKNKGIGGFNCAMIVSAQEANMNTAIQMNGGCISGLAYKAISVSSSKTLTRDVVSVACLNTGGISITLPDMDVFDDGHVIKIKRLNGVDKDNAVRIYAGYGYHDILNETSKEYVRTKKQTCIRADAMSVYALDPRILPSVGDAIELVYHRDVHIGAYYGCWVEYKHPRDW